MAEFEYPQRADGIVIVVKEEQPGETTLNIYVDEQLHAALIGQHWKADGHGHRIAGYKLTDEGDFSPAAADGCPFDGGG